MIRGAVTGHAYQATVHPDGSWHRQNGMVAGTPFSVPGVPVALTDAQMSLRGQIAANTRWSKEDPAVNAGRGQRGLIERFRREVDPDGTLPEAERERRAQCAYRAHFQRLALASSKARAARKAGSDAT